MCASVSPQLLLLFFLNIIPSVLSLRRRSGYGAQETTVSSLPKAPALQDVGVANYFLNASTNESA